MTFDQIAALAVLIGVVGVLIHGKLRADVVALTGAAVLLLLGVPVAFSIGLSSLATILYEGLPLAVGFQQMISGMNPFSFLAIPFFIFAGEIMMYGGIADRIVDFAKSLAGHVRGGLGMSNVIGCTLFGGVAGSPLADVSAMGSVMIPLMKKEGYDADYAVNVTTHAALVGALMPTSHNLIIFTLATTGIASVSVFSKSRVLISLISSSNLSRSRSRLSISARVASSWGFCCAFARTLSSSSLRFL